MYIEEVFEISTNNDWNLPVAEIEDLGDECYLIHHIGGELSFLYEVSDEVICYYSMLCEVGAFVTTIFAEALGRYKTEEVELDASPYFILRKLK